MPESSEDDLAPGLPRIDGANEPVPDAGELEGADEEQEIGLDADVAGDAIGGIEIDDLATTASLAGDDHEDAEDEDESLSEGEGERFTDGSEPFAPEFPDEHDDGDLPSGASDRGEEAGDFLHGVQLVGSGEEIDACRDDVRLVARTPNDGTNLASALVSADAEGWSYFARTDPGAIVVLRERRGRVERVLTIDEEEGTGALRATVDAIHVESVVGVEPITRVSIATTRERATVEIRPRVRGGGA